MTLIRLVVVLFALALAACGTTRGHRESHPRGDRPLETKGRGTDTPGESAPLPPGQLAMYPRSAADLGTGPAVLSLLSQAQGDLSAGRPEQAQAALERALRIESRNPFIWQALAQVSLLQDQPEQAETNAQKSLSYARGNPFIEVDSWKLIASARSRRGDAAGAEQAQGRAESLQRSLP